MREVYYLVSANLKSVFSTLLKEQKLKNAPEYDLYKLDFTCHGKVSIMKKKKKKGSKSGTFNYSAKPNKWHL